MKGEVQSQTPHELATKWIAELTEAGYTYNDMIAVFNESRRMFEAYKARMEKLKNQEYKKIEI